MILYVGLLFYGSTALHRLEAVKTIENDIDFIDLTLKHNLFNRSINFLCKRLFNNYFDFLTINNQLIKKAKEQQYAIIWIDKGVIIKKTTLLKLKNINPNVKLVHYSPDDMLNPNITTKNYIECIPIYDLHITTKSYNIDELKLFGAKNVIFVNNAFSLNTHKKILLNSNETTKFKTEVSFIGMFEKDRFEKICFLANNGIKVTVWGGDKGWKKYVNNHKNIVINNNFVWGDEFSKAINGTLVNLCFLRKENRDLQTTRSVEIPACGGFMLAERTNEHQNLFKEGEEADFFSDENELLNKVIFYLKNEILRNQIKEKGYVKCTKNYTNEAMVKSIFEYMKQNKI